MLPAVTTFHGPFNASSDNKGNTMKSLITLSSAVVALGVGSVAFGQEKPNVVVIISDDQGYADVSYNPHHSKEVRTPHTDALARAGVVCTQAYTSGHVCSPTRAGLMTGRYQQRFGIYMAGEGGSGVPLDEVFFPQYLKPAGYVSGALGKWHLGVDLKYNAIHRGFDEFYGFMGRGAHDYFELNNPEHPIYRGLQPIEDRGYLTDRITEEAVSFIKRHKGKPFFLYVAYNAVHAPPQAPEDEIKHQTGDATRDTLMAMLVHLDDGVGRIVAALHEHGLFDNTLLFYLTDNGGSRAMHADNAPLRGFKQDDYEGGVRVPFIVSWPRQLEAGTTCDVPVFSIDILPTALAAAELPAPTDTILDGKNILPALQGEDGKVHDHLFWSSGGREGKWAVRSGKWKLVGRKKLVELFDLEADLGETTDLSKQLPDKVAELTKLHDSWLDEMAEPVSGAPKRWSPDVEAKQTGKKTKKEQRKNRRRNKPPKGDISTKASTTCEPEGFEYDSPGQRPG
jgi:arylsulfatase A-like enzyme